VVGDASTPPTIVSTAINSTNMTDLIPAKEKKSTFTSPRIFAAPE